MTEELLNDWYGEAEQNCVDEVDAQLQALHQGFQVQDERDVDFVLNKQAGWKAEIDRRTKAHNAAVRKLEAQIKWFDVRFGASLQQFAQRQLAEPGNKARSFTLPCGVRIGFRAQPRVLAVRDEAAYQNWVETNLPEALSVVQTVKIDKKRVNENWKTLGEVPDGVVIEGGDDAFYTKF